VDDRERLDELVRQENATLVVVTTAYRGERAGCLVGFHTQCSIEPARVAVWISKANHTCRVALQAEHLAVHHLGREHLELARVFGERSGDDVDKFAECAVETGPADVPLLADCPDRVVGRRTSYFDDGGDHVCFVVEPLTVERSPGVGRPPLRLADASDLEPGHGATERPDET
jgi:flavin reductase (DIM6/NTAB) family NADH-FMN oxidoreductase RutF